MSSQFIYRKGMIYDIFYVSWFVVDIIISQPENSEKYRTGKMLNSHGFES